MTQGADRDQEFTAFVVARSAQLVRIARMLCGDQGLAEDLVQTALEKAYVRWNRIELGDPFSYVRRAVVNQHLSWLRRRPWRERPVEAPGEVRPGFMHVDDPAPGVQQRVTVEAALAALTRRERAVVVLRFIEDLSEAETAATLGVAIGTVKSTSSRALTKLRSSPELTDITIGGQA
ncbi:SigE family RNA polymerase sigma factor [Kribbella sancticallisti]|uniref:SigE family RNA polymerase sigma factor n=1 Tax=Kribbella sancticallisti TaxID=460087 RepID=A0ABN2DY34_9ACTN